MSFYYLSRKAEDVHGPLSLPGTLLVRVRATTHPYVRAGAISLTKKRGDGYSLGLVGLLVLKVLFVVELFVEFMLDERPLGLFVRERLLFVPGVAQVRFRPQG